jgi:hypothetical protein
MAEQRKEGVKVKATGNKDMEKDYGPGDFEVLYSRGEWRNWDEEIKWLEENGESDNELTPGETIAMKEDIMRLKENDEPFESDYQMAYEKAHRNR